MANPHKPTRYNVLILPSARRQLRQLERTHHHQQRGNLVSAILSLGDNPRPVAARRLVNREEWRLRVGDHRILFLIDDQQLTVTVTAIAHRRDVYRR